MTVGRLSALLFTGCLLAGGALAADPPLPSAAPAASPALPPAPAAATGTVPAAVPAAVPGAAASAPVAAPAPVSPGRPTVQAPAYTPGPSAGSLIQTIFALILVLGLLAALAWVMKRYGPNVQAGAGGLRIVGALNLGGRERIMVVEIGDQWIVVGASPGRVNALATMPRQAGPATISGHTAPASSFAQWLKQTIDKRNAQ